MYTFCSMMYFIVSSIGIVVNKDSKSLETSSLSSSNGRKIGSMYGNRWVFEMEYMFWHNGFKWLEMILAALYVNVPI